MSYRPNLRDNISELCRFLKTIFQVFLHKGAHVEWLVFWTKEALEGGPDPKFWSTVPQRSYK